MKTKIESLIYQNNLYMSSITYLRKYHTDTNEEIQDFKEKIFDNNEKIKLLQNGN